MDDPQRPPCMSEREWQAWLEANALVPGKSAHVTPCADCTPEFMGEMADIDRCEVQREIRRRLGITR